jgi:class 3 adenylate cyclase
MPTLPTGTVTFAFSDIEGSTELLKRLGDERYGELLGAHRRLVRDIFAAHEGLEIDTQGDAFFCSFRRARQAVAASVDVQRAHERYDWPDGARVRVRIGLHTGEPAVGDEGYTGLDVVRAARIAAVARGGQILLSETTRALIGSDPPEGVEIHALGPRRLKDIDHPEPLHELRVEGVELEPADERSTPEVPVPPPPPEPRRLPDLRSVFDGMPGFVRDAARASLGEPGSSRDAIEERVLAELRESLSGPRLGPRRRAIAAGPAAGGRRTSSLADELERLRSLRDSGALTDDQYERAVERALEAEDRRPDET